MMSRVGSCWTTAKQRKNVRRLLNPGFITVRHVIVRSLTGVPEPSTLQNSCWTQRDSELSKCSDQIWRCSWPDSSSAVAMFVSVCRHVNALKLLQEVSENGSQLTVLWTSGSSVVRWLFTVVTTAKNVDILVPWIYSIKVHFSWATEDLCLAQGHFGTDDVKQEQVFLLHVPVWNKRPKSLSQQWLRETWVVDRRAWSSGLLNVIMKWFITGMNSCRFRTVKTFPSHWPGLSGRGGVGCGGEGGACAEGRETSRDSQRTAWCLHSPPQNPRRAGEPHQTLVRQRHLGLIRVFNKRQHKNK